MLGLLTIRFNHLKYNSMVFSILTDLCNYHRNQFRTFSSPQKKPFMSCNCHPLLSIPSLGVPKQPATFCLYGFASSVSYLL